MACRSVLKVFFITQMEPWPPLPLVGEKRSNFAPLVLPHKKISIVNPNRGRRRLASIHESSHFAINCLSSGKSDYSKPDPPQEALLRAISEVSKREGRVGKATIVVIGGTVSSDDSTTGWLALDRKLNSYPRTRGFTAIGTGGEDFVQSMIYAVESVVQRPIPEGQVRQKTSSRGKYVSVKIGPVQVASSEQVQAVYYAMRSDDRMKYFL